MNMKKFPLLKHYDFDRILVNGCSIDRNGNWYVLHQDIRNTISIYNHSFDHQVTIDIKDAIEAVERTFPHFVKPGIGSIYRNMEDNIVLGMSNCSICTITPNGVLLNLISIKLPEEVHGYYCQFEDLVDNKILLTVKTGDNGTLLAVSKFPIKDFGMDSLVEWRYLNDSIPYPELYFPGIKNLSGSSFNTTNSIGYRLLEISKNFMNTGGSQNNDYFPSTHHKIAQTIPLKNGNFVLYTVSDARSRSRVPDKNTPYYFFTIDGESGDILHTYSPEDRSMHKWNYYGQVVRLANQYWMYKTYNSILLFDEEFKLVETLSLERKFSSLREYTLLAKFQNYIYLANQKEQFIIQSTIDDKLSLAGSMLNLANNLKSMKK